MGGKAFESEGISTPRMPPDIYYKVLDQVRTKLKPFYTLVESPIEAPEKTDHGDIDIFAIPATDIPLSGAELVTILNAITSKENGPTIYLAVPWPATTQSSTTEPDSGEPPTGDIEEAMDTLCFSETDASHSITRITKSIYAQVDLHVCKDTAELRYMLFMYNHGDIMNIIRGIIRRFGLTCSTSGFHIRIAELESYNKKLARYKVFDQPEEILEYLGMDEKRFWEPFKTWEECMDYAATCRFHDPGKGKKTDDIKTAAMIADDRKRLSTRSMFRYWIETYLPSHRDAPAGSASQMSRNEVIEEVKLLKGRAFAMSFDKHRSHCIREMQEQQLWTDLRKEIDAEGSRLTYAIKGLRRAITVVPDDDELRSDVQKDYAAGRLDEVKTWCFANWDEVGMRQESIDKDKSMAKYLDRLEKEGKLKSQDGVDQESFTAGA